MVDYEDMEEHIQLTEMRHRPETPVEPEVSLNPNPYQNLPSRPSVVDFDSIATINGWARLQKIPTRRSSVFLTYFVESVIVTFEIYFLWAVILQGEGVPQFGFEQMVTLITLTVTSMLHLAGKLWLDGCLRRWQPYSCKDALHFFGTCQLQLNRPIRYMRTVYYWHKKNLIIGKEFVHGETVTKEELVRVTKINKDELIAARDDLCETFIQGIPMALVQLYLLNNVPSPLKVCSFRDFGRLLYIAIQVFGAAKCCMIYEWKKNAYINSLHVQGYLFTNGRFPVPEYTENQVTLILRCLCHFFAISARFFHIRFMMAIHWAMGFVAVGLLLLFHVITMCVSPSALASTVQNLPEGVSLPATCLTDYWINIFTVKDTAFYQMIRQAVKTRSGRTIRFPLVLIQVLPYIFTFCSLYVSALLYNLNLDRIQLRPVVLNETLLEEIGNSTYCPHHDPSKSVFDYYDFISVTLDTLGRSLNTIYDPSHGLSGFLSLHLLLLFIQILFVLSYDYYKSKYFETMDTSYPIMLTCGFFKKVYKSICEITEDDPSMKRYMLRSLLFLMSVDLPTFYGVYFAFRGLSREDEDPVKFWDDQFTEELEKKFPVQVSCRQSEVEDYKENLNDLPIFVEMEDAYNAMKEDPASIQLYYYFCMRIDRVLSYEMTSHRLEKMFDLYGMSARDLCVEVVEDMTTNPVIFEI